jgi:hypothetical protein
MQACHESDIKNINAVFPWLGNHKSPAVRDQHEEILMHNRKYPAIRQMHLKWQKWLGLAQLLNGFNRHPYCYIMAGRFLQSARISAKIEASARFKTVAEIPPVESPQKAVKAAIARKARGKK